MKTTFAKAKPKEILCRSYKHFDNTRFRDDLKKELYSDNNNINVYSYFEKTFLKVLNNYAPMKKKVVRANEVPYMTKALRKAIATRSRLEHRVHKTRTEESINVFKKQKNYCSKLYKKERKKFYANLDPKNVIDGEIFWILMKPFFSDKGLKNQNITLIDDNRLITSDHEVAETLNTFFDNVVRTLNIQAPINCINTIGNIKDPAQAAILKYADHPSILKITEVITKTPFSFQNVSMNEIEIELKKINTTKGNTFKNIPAKLLKVNNDICCEPLCNIINNGINSSEFDNELKSADVTPVFKSDDVTDKKNYQPISVLPVVFKIFERVIQKQLASHINNFLSTYLCGYRKGFNAQHALLALLDKWITILDKKG